MAELVGSGGKSLTSPISCSLLETHGLTSQSAVKYWSLFSVETKHRSLQISPSLGDIPVPVPPTCLQLNSLSLPKWK